MADAQSETDLTLDSPELEMLRQNKQDGYNYRERRHEDWDENYTLYRDKVSVNRLTQRQSVNVPLMKIVIMTSLKDVDDMPVVYFENLDNDKEAELFKNEYWKWTGEPEQNNFEVQDIVDKKQVFLYGRSFDQWQIINGMVKMTVQDVYDILVSRYADPTNIHSSRFLIHTHIFKSFSELEKNSDYDQKKVAELKQWYGTTKGLIKAADNARMLVEKNQRMEDMGLQDVTHPVLGEAIVELTMHFVYRKEEGDDEEQLYLYVVAEDMKILMKKRLEAVIGPTKDHFWRNHYPYGSWASDIERLDFWSDGIADIARVPNKVLNAWLSQLVENRTLRNFGMHYYNSTAKDGWSPGTFNPVPWGWYGLPGKPSEILQKVDIPELSESLDEMAFVINLVERATGVTSTQQGVQTERKITLGEIQLALGEAKERVKSMSKFYTTAWKQRGLLFLRLIEAAGDRLKPVKIYHEGRNTSDIYERTVSPEDWRSKAGYRCKVWSQDDKNTQDENALQKLAALMNSMPDNFKLREIYQRKLAEYAGLKPNEISDVMEFEEQKREALLAVQASGMGGNVMPGSMPGAHFMTRSLQQPQPGMPS